MQQTRWLTHTGTAFAVSILSISLLSPESVSAQFEEGCNFYGCSESDNAECNIYGCPKPDGGECTVYGCPNPGAEDCDASGCPDSPPAKPDDNSNNSGDRGRNDRPISGECMDRVMYQEFRATSDRPVDSAVYKGYYTYSLPFLDYPDGAISKAGFVSPSAGMNWHKDPVVRIQMKSPEEAAKACR